jgi:tetratricopeptide (TPR) repeat protein
VIAQTIPEHQYSDYIRFLLLVLDRDYPAALEELSGSDFASFVGQDFFVPRQLLMASVYCAMGDEAQCRTFAASALDRLDEALRESPEDPRVHMSCGLALAFLGRPEEAVTEGQAAVDSCPLSRDAYLAPRYILGLAQIHAVVGNARDAIRLLDRLLSMPSGNILSVSMLRIDPSWDSIRSHPDFQEMLSRHSGAGVGGVT